MNDSLINRLVRPELQALGVYRVENAAGLIKLDAMENPYPWPEEMRDAWLQILAGADMNRYPDPSATGVKNKLREAFALPEHQGLILGNGSDELIQIIVTALSGPDSRVLTVAPSFVMYRRCAVALGMPCDEVSLADDDFSLDRNAVLDQMQQQPPTVIFLAYPNNPTGNLFDDDDISAIVAAAPCPVVIDEAYEPFASRSWIERSGERDRVLVMRTLSKLGLAGLRLGYLVGPPAWIQHFEKIRLPYNVNILTQLSVEFALAHYETFREQARKIVHQREMLFRAMSQLNDVHVWPSASNFLLFRPVAPADAVFEGLRRRGLLIKNLHGTGPLLENCLRVTVGTPEDNESFLSALLAALANQR